MYLFSSNVSSFAIHLNINIYPDDKECYILIFMNRFEH